MSKIKGYLDTGYFRVPNEQFDEDVKIRRLTEIKKTVKGKKIGTGIYKVEYKYMNGDEKTIYNYFLRLLEYQGQDWYKGICPSMKTIGIKIGHGEDYARKCVDVLCDNGFITKESTYRKNGSQGSNIYTITTEYKELVERLKVAYNGLKDCKIEEENLHTLPTVNAPISTVKVPTAHGNIFDESYEENNPTRSEQGGHPIRTGGAPDQNGGAPRSERDETNNNLNKQYLNKQYLNNNNNKNKGSRVTTGGKKELKHSCVVEDLKNLINGLKLKFTDEELNDLIIHCEKKCGKIDIDYIAKQIEYVNTKSVKNVMAYTKTCITKDYGSNIRAHEAEQQPQAKGSFNDFEQRNYSKDDWKNLEKGLLGWTNKAENTESI